MYASLVVSNSWSNQGIKNVGHIKIIANIAPGATLPARQGARPAIYWYTRHEFIYAASRVGQSATLLPGNHRGAS